MTVFLSDIMLESALKTLHEQQNLMVQNIITARHAMIEEEKKTAGKLITEATTYIKTEINEEISKNLNSVSQQMQTYKNTALEISAIESNINKTITNFTKEIKLYTLFIGASLFANILCFFAIIIHHFLY
ncbi:hypothetical protein [Bartonella melophagi]|uniref:Uncharacterized protein n=1 Tax=Bartonella melophagi K-2C TaxID=1094557 RepID=J0ZIK1_9HYPH|nr:hypothetical protein [Bartonella melophagi]EJF88038.1 hypothetical protein ME3_01310 [Bartonella melophagi K-2C]